MDEAEALCDRVAVVDKGKVIALGTPRELIRSLGAEHVIEFGMQRPDGHLEDWYGEGNYNRTLLLYALMKSQGVMPAEKAPGLQLGAVREGDALRLHVGGVSAVRLQFDIARHRRVINLARNYVRLNEFPEWFVVEPGWLYRVSGGAEPPRLRLGAELMHGERFAAGEWRVEPVGPPPYGNRPLTP